MEFAFASSDHVSGASVNSFESVTTARSAPRSAAPSRPAAVDEPAARPVREHQAATRSLRSKALLTFALVAGYVMMVGAYLQHDRTDVLMVVRELEETHLREELVGRVAAAVSQASLVVNEAHFATTREPNWTAVALSAESVVAGLLAASDRSEELAGLGMRLQGQLTRVMRERNRDSLIELRHSVQEIVLRLESTAASLRESRHRLSGAYRQGFEGLTLKSVAFALFGMTVFGVMMGYYFARMAWDVRRLERRALRIVNGYRGPPLDVTRYDEIGTLMRSVNEMQAELRSRESRLEIERQERMHKEKMAAVGTLAAGIAHEINNPIAAITGVAQEIDDTLRQCGCVNLGANCRPDLIIQHARRIAAITQQISAFSAPGSPEPEFVDLNSLVESVCGFVRYDQRFRPVELTTDLDRSLPAVEAIADHITQVLMNLLMNAADACSGKPAGSARVHIRTHNEGDVVAVTVQDNGCGMDGKTLSRAFEEYFTTKPLGRGTGIGLAVCRRLADGFGGSLSLESVAGAGTTARVVIPVPEMLRG